MTRTRKTIFALACTGALTFAGGAFAAGSTQLNVAGTVTATCQFASSSYEMSFGDLDPSSTADAVTRASIGYRCTNGTAASSIMINGGTSTTTVSMGQTTGSGTLPVKLDWTTPPTLGSGFGSGVAPITFSVVGRILATDLNTALAGGYMLRQPITLLP